MSHEKRIPALDTLRAVAILSVLACHFIHLIPEQVKPVANLMKFGATGVDLFFVLSGFLIGSIIVRELDGSSNLNLPRFLWRRWMRTLPAYFAVLGFLFIASRFGKQTLPGDYSWHYLFFLQNYVTDMVRFGISWSLCVEEHFYAVLPLLTVAIRWMWPALPIRTIFRAVALLALAGTNATRAGVWLAHPDFAVMPDGEWSLLAWQAIASKTHMRLDSLAVGILVATMPRPRHAARSAFAAVVAVAGLLALSAVSPERWFVFFGYLPVALCYGVLVHVSAGGNAWSGVNIPGAKLTSDLSYSLYLTHQTVMLFYAKVWGSGFGYLFTLILIVSCFVAAAVLRYGVELPFMRFRARHEHVIERLGNPRANVRAVPSDP